MGAKKKNNNNNPIITSSVIDTSDHHLILTTLNVITNPPLHLQPSHIAALTKSTTIHLLIILTTPCTNPLTLTDLLNSLHHLCL